MDENFQELLLSEIVEYFKPLQHIVDEEDGALIFLNEIGWDVETLFGPDVTIIIDMVEGLVTVIQEIEVLAQSNVESFEDIANVLHAITPLVRRIEAISGISITLPSGIDIEELVGDIFNALTIIHIKRKSDFLFDTLTLLTIIQRPKQEYIVSNNTIVRTKHKFPKINFEQLGALFSDPAKVFKDEYYPLGLPDLPETNKVAQKLFNRLAFILDNLGVQSFIGRGMGPLVLSAAEEERIEGMITIKKEFPPIEERGKIRLGATIHLIPENEGGAGVYISPFGSAELDLALSDWNLITALNAGVDGIRITQNGFEIVTGLGTNFVEFNIRLEKRGSESNPALLIGSSTGTRFEMRQYVAGVRIVMGDQGEEYGFFTELKNCAVVVALGQGDGFLSSVGGDGFRIDFDLLTGWSNVAGIYFGGNIGMEINLPTHIQAGPIEVCGLKISLRLRESTLALELSSTFKFNVGPLTAVVENIGLRLITDFTPPTKNAGPFNIAFKFKPPNGVGLSIDAAVVKGGGYLFFDFDREEYAGVLQLSISGIVTITAIGMITTKMPDGSKGFSLLIIMSVEFNPGIQLGFGFTIVGIGGLIGLNRTMRLDALVQGVRTGTINNIMFPQGDIIANAPRIISDLRAMFPPEEGKFLIGPMIKLGWGTPTLITVSLGVIIEIPGNIAIIGVLRVVLPDKEAPVLVLQIAFVGAIEFDKKRLWFFASMFESRVLFMTIEGEMGLLVGWGDDANFVVSVGGFHPRFNPPPLPFPNPQRIAVNIMDEQSCRIRVEGYFAVTSNTVQFGARAELVLGIDDFGIEGHIQFDALFQFSPFYFVISISASVSLKAFGIGVFSIRLEFELEGPTPWRAHGRGSISLFFFDISADFDITWGESQDTTLPAKDIIDDLVKEIEKFENWKAELPVANNLFVALRGLDEKTEALVLHPLGNLRISQRLIPLDILIDKIGNEKPNDANKFELKAPATGLTKKSDSLEPFAMAQFKNMDDASKLTLPAFEKQHSGIELSASGNPLKTSRVVSRIVRYEEIIIDTNYKRFATKFKSLIGSLFGHFLNGNAVTKLNISQAYKSKVNPFDDKIQVGSDTYTVALNDTNKPFNSSKLYFDSHALAEEYMRTEIAKQPNLVESLHVIPQFEAVGV